MSMSQRDRAAFLYEAGREGLPIEVARKLLRYGTTLHRLAEAQCNGDWPLDGPWNRLSTGEHRFETDVCKRCEGSYDVRALVEDKARSRQLTANPMTGESGRWRVCPDCRTSDAVKALLAEVRPPGLQRFVAKFQGDPRGAVLVIVAPSGRELVAG